MPDCNFIKGNKNKKIGAANIILPANAKITPSSRENTTIKNLIFFEIFFVLALANHANAKIKIVKINIPRKRKFIY